MEVDESDLTLNQAALKAVQASEKARSVIAPTDDAKVKLMLRSLQEPITCFGEGPFERRERLRNILAKSDNLNLKKLTEKLRPEEEEEDDENEEFFTEGSPTLLDTRKEILFYSIEKARGRLQAHKTLDMDENLRKELRHSMKRNYIAVKSLELKASQIAATRPIGSCSLNPDASILATGCFDGSLSLWNVPMCDKYRMSLEGSVLILNNF
jgi:U4/U6 small nuclear ribonucleoprotein PRP4